MNFVRVPLSVLEQLSTKALRSLRYTDAEATILTNCMMYAQLRGNTQSFLKFEGGIPMRTALTSVVSPAINWQGTLAAVDGQQLFGMVAMHKLVQNIITTAHEGDTPGVRIATLSNVSSSTGAVGYWAQQLAGNNVMSIIMSQSPEYVAPHGSRSAIFGTNPIAFGFPQSTGPPVVVDVATSATTWYNVIQAKQTGRTLPQVDIALDKHGHSTSDPDLVLDGGALKPFGGRDSHKASALSLAIEMMCVGLAGGSVLDKAKAGNWGNIIISIDPRKVRIDAIEYVKIDDG
jgi:LDH2 family malate/lactate/ureidoglycolate dehydrogenase